MKKKLTDIEAVKKKVDEFKQNKKPTLAGLCRMLKVAPNTLYRAMDDEDEVGDLLMDAYLYLVQMHEEGLYNASCYGHAFWLRSIRKYIDFSGGETVVDQKNVSKSFILNIIEPDKDENA